MPWNFQLEIVDCMKCMYVYHTHQQVNNSYQVSTVGVIHVLVQGFDFEPFDLSSLDFSPRSVKLVNCTVDLHSIRRDFDTLELLDCQVLNQVQAPFVRRLVLRSFINISQLYNMECEELVISCRLNSQLQSEQIHFGALYKIRKITFENLIIDVSTLEEVQNFIEFKNCTVFSSFNEQFQAVTRFQNCLVDLQSVQSVRYAEYEGCRIINQFQNDLEPEHNQHTYLEPNQINEYDVILK
ncbi:Hypothetical_protein [Hexamita inflata]|uniref:Hypothetical_protein n=1 Tax=Hexamita inflata TaxID=28002 RepID=A0AA86V0X1_9EUKA|nr:Hypothetical protein HINF_LOCUS63854 [Hexamita inflata]